MEFESLGLSLSAFHAAGAVPGPSSAAGSSLFTCAAGQSESSLDAATGHADLVLPSGVAYCGATVRGLRHGRGLLTLQDGTTYDGDFEGGEATGAGVIAWTDGSTYEGGVQRGVRHGEGRLRHAPSGSEYVGGWVQGQRQGWGVMRYGCGAVYQGQWQQGGFVGAPTPGVGTPKPGQPGSRRWED